MSGLIIGLVIGCAIAMLLVLCFIRSICKDKNVRDTTTPSFFCASVIFSLETRMGRFQFWGLHSIAFLEVGGISSPFGRCFCLQAFHPHTSNPTLPSFPLRLSCSGWPPGRSVFSLLLCRRMRSLRFFLLCVPSYR